MRVGRALESRLRGFVCVVESGLPTSSELLLLLLLSLSRGCVRVPHFVKGANDDVLSLPPLPADRCCDAVTAVSRARLLPSSSLLFVANAQCVVGIVVRASLTSLTPSHRSRENRFTLNHAHRKRKRKLASANRCTFFSLPGPPLGPSLASMRRWLITNN